jgi:hypothetical protein
MDVRECSPDMVRAGNPGREEPLFFILTEIFPPAASETAWANSFRAWEKKLCSPSWKIISPFAGRSCNFFLRISKVSSCMREALYDK